MRRETWLAIYICAENFQSLHHWCTEPQWHKQFKTYYKKAFKLADDLAEWTVGLTDFRDVGPLASSMVQSIPVLTFPVPCVICAAHTQIQKICECLKYEDEALEGVRNLISTELEYWQKEYHYFSKLRVLNVLENGGQNVEGGD